MEGCKEKDRREARGKGKRGAMDFGCYCVFS